MSRSRSFSSSSGGSNCIVSRLLLPLAVITTLAILNSFWGLAEAHEEHRELASNDVSLKDVCANRQVPIIAVSVAKKMIKQLRRKPSLCPESYRQSIYELEPILMLAKNERVCSDHKFQQIVDYHFRYVNPKQETYEFFDDLNNLNKEIVKRPLQSHKFHHTVQLDEYAQEIMIPIAMQQFFKAWALQVSGMCKKALVDNLERAIQATMTDEDLDIMDKLIMSEKEVAKSRLKVGASFSGIMYMPEIEGRSEEDDGMSEGVATLDFTNDPQMNLFMHACKYRYQPIYWKLVVPIVRLAKLGYDYMGKHLETVAYKLEREPNVGRWVALTSLCEAHGKFELVEPEANPLVMEQLVYEPNLSFRPNDVLWVKGAEALQKELDLIRGVKSTGLRRLKYQMGVKGRQAVAVLDPHQFAFYRRNQNTIANILNFFSISWNMISVITTLAVGRR